MAKKLDKTGLDYLLSKLIDGTIIVGKAKSDEEGNNLKKLAEEIVNKLDKSTLVNSTWPWVNDVDFGRTVNGQFYRNFILSRATREKAGAYPSSHFAKVEDLPSANDLIVRFNDLTNRIFALEQLNGIETTTTTTTTTPRPNDTTTTTTTTTTPRPSTTTTTTTTTTPKPGAMSAEGGETAIGAINEKEF